MQILTVAQMQYLERVTHDGGFTYAEMMENAGRGVAEVVKEHLFTADQQILVLVGPGNNGGDGLVAARVLHSAGYHVLAYLSRKRDPETDFAFQQAATSGVPLLYADTDEKSEALISSVESATVLIDALLGTGSTPPLQGSIARILQTVHTVLRRKSTPSLLDVQLGPVPIIKNPLIISVDGPSGMNFDTGEMDDLSLAADITVTFAAPKWGHVKRPAANFIGRLIVVDIGITESSSIKSNYSLATPGIINNSLPCRPPDAHKGTFGKALIVAGSANYTGAAILSAQGALRSGAGLVTLAIPSSLHGAVVSAIPEATYLLLPHTLGIVNEQAVPVLTKHWDGYSALLVGPGLGNTPESLRFLRNLLLPPDRKDRPGFVTSEIKSESPHFSPPALVIDADGLNLLAQIPDWYKHLPANTILTPHPGEMARLTGLKTDEIIRDRFEIATHWAQIWNHIVLLKGANTIIAHPDGYNIVMPFSNPGLSTAGSGDVLAGAIIALRAQGLSPFDAAVTGAYIHGFAGEICRKKIGTAGMIAGDVAYALADALHGFEKAS